MRPCIPQRLQGVPLTLNALELRHLTATSAELSEILGRRYIQQVVTQVYKVRTHRFAPPQGHDHARSFTIRELTLAPVLVQVVGSVDLIGNPVNLFNNLSTGVEDFFYEPFQGFMESPQSFARGLGRGTPPPLSHYPSYEQFMGSFLSCTASRDTPGTGTASLLRNSVYGIFDGVSRITGSVGKGLAEATLDESFKERRREDSRQKPSNVVTGVASGAVTIAKGIGSGLAGVFTKPVEGAKSGGALGFFKGVGQGAVGVVTKPVVSVFDGATQGAPRPPLHVHVFRNHSPAAPLLFPY